MPKHSTSTDSKVLDRIRGHRRGWVFTPAHLTDLGSRNAVASALKRFKADGMIRQLARGLYDYPVHDSVLGTVTPSADAIARALVVRDAIRLQPSGAYAANVLGLSEQVPFQTHPERLWTRDVASPQHSKSASFPNPPHPVFGWLCWTGPVVFNPEAVGSL